LESDLGLNLVDYRVSWLAECKPFFEFTHLLFERHRELHAIYNAALAEYRAVNHIRSRSHPVPELTTNDPWWEVPWWIWDATDAQRQRAFLRETKTHFELSDGRQPRIALPKRDPAAWWGILMPQFVKLRPRALMTTMYARLMLSDLFVHGIGGAKYDELTDLIIRRFFGMEPPAYLTATATFRLPIDRPQVTLDDVRHSAQRIRELRYRPESFLRDERVKRDAHLSSTLSSLAADKRDFLDRHDLRRCSPDVFAQLDRLNRAMHQLLEPAAATLRAQHAELVEQARQAQLLGSREFSFVLFPSKILPARLLDLCKVLS
jgi:hypothetical protein